MCVRAASMVGVGVGGKEFAVRGRGVGELVIEGALEVPEEVLDRLPVCHAGIPRKAS